MHADAYRFDRFELRPHSRELLADGEPARLGGRGFDLLLALVEQRHRVVSREELFDRVWAGRVVEDQNLRVQVNALRKLLGERSIATVPGRGYRFVLPLLEAAGDQAPAADERPEAASEVAQRPGPAWPEPPTLFGRGDELGEVCRLLQDQRLLTVAGPGGIGKTRVAQAVAHRLQSRFADGVGWVDFGALADAAALPSTLARALALPGSGSPDAVARALRGQAMLVVLDNCEHLADEISALARTLLEAAPRLKLLATSQQPLRLPGEQVYRLQPLPVPPAPEAGMPELAPGALLAYGAVELFVARVQSLQPRFALDAETAQAVAAICRQLDGLPLALELGAARVPLLGVQGVQQRLGESLQLLRGGLRGAPERQQTLRGALAWSHALLPEEAQRALRRLAPFAGSFALADAQHVVAGSDLDAWDALDLLGLLVDRSLVQVIDGPSDAEPRARLLDATRAFARERLAAASEATDAYRHHAEAMRRRIELADARFLGTPSGQWLQALLPDLDNLREAFRFSLQAGERETAVVLAASSAGLWIMGGLLVEGLSMLRAVRAWDDASLPPRLRSRLALALAQYGAGSVSDATPGDALAAARAAIEGYHALGDALHEYWARYFAIPLAERAGERVDVDAELARMKALESPDWPPLALRLRRSGEARQLARKGDWPAYRDAFRDEARRLAALGEQRGAWFAAQSHALAELVLGRPREAVAAIAPSVEQIRAQGRLRQTWTPLGLLVAALTEAGELEQAAHAMRELMPLMAAEGSPAWGIDHASLFLLYRGDHEGAALLHGWSNEQSSRRGEQRGPGIRQAHERVRAGLTEYCDEATLQALLQRGAQMDEEAVVARVLGAC
jgi:predicted ATPase/DNA-binding winged helix-turn-helix (wHTH) protein